MPQSSEWNPDEHPRGAHGQFASRERGTAEVTLGFCAGDRVSYRGGPPYRVARISGPLHFLKNVAGGTLIASADELEPIPERAQDRDAVRRAEASLNMLSAAMRSSTLQQKQDLNNPRHPDDRLEAAFRVASAAIGDGKVDRHLWMMADTLSNGMPLAARSAIIGVVVRGVVPEMDYREMTRRWHEVMGLHSL